MTTRPKCWKNAKLGYEAKTLVSIGFSLWRAAFLADKSGDLKETNEHATYFLGEMLETNAIAFTQDRKARGFTSTITWPTFDSDSQNSRKTIPILKSISVS